MVEGRQSFEYNFTGSVEYDSEGTASMICEVLSVDPELHPDQVRRSLSTDGAVLKMQFSATEPKMLRAAVGTFFDLLALATRTYEAFGPVSSEPVLEGGEQERVQA
uniref:Polarized growth chromatin-associated controller 1 n=2 Tax=Tetraselmis sp. GSL018 TaxID=582737 RepID=A0A061QQD6_9CHLO|mmetsp:Transcript_15898/g.37690  ORF Transcript_15898/g.37690 Transcript_15898/m.37690 type:complete len:106 (+) Transcript_15898:135-452(+)|eukprot:CAMPEP_0177622690 /NCGR_PEP_ID=MMETSP0419_2-20121207/28436_1 /TAXON_ID=582737 /ORGANISM="Tetraselmis sp., Strain GSL018" /LENGTH=105 /DNA_ID=CAMNT_0019123057 /DNA_START=99 /DNA_END=416 /DNA_ORIENTATION=+